MINVTRPFLPPRVQFDEYIDGIWQRDILTNNGPLVRELEQKLADYLRLNNILFLGNGTVALQLALKALAVTGEVITTPFTYVATASSIVWENCTPVFVDIDSRSLNIDPGLIEDAITDRTSAILATHVFGNPCNIDRIETIARKHGLKVIFDAAHCFAVQYKGKSVLGYGDASCISFHATKLFHTVEGGGVTASAPELLEKLFHMRNFGHAGFYRYKGVGINGKNSEIHAAMGLCNLRYIDVIRQSYQRLSEEYTANLDGEKITHQLINPDAAYNYAYYPVVFANRNACLAVLENLEQHQISPRRYFYPTLNTLEYVTASETPVAEDISARILCLPLYHDLDIEQVRFICECINCVL